MSGCVLMKLASAFIFIAVLASNWKYQKLQDLPVRSGSIEEWFSTSTALSGLRALCLMAACVSAATTDEPEPPVKITRAPWSIAACSAVWLSCADSLLSNCSSSIFTLSLPFASMPLALTCPMPNCRCCSISWPTLANGPLSGSM